MKKLQLLVLLMFSFASATIAQKTVTGVITDTSGEPLIAATVMAQGTTVGTSTDLDGSFSLVMPEGSSALEISYTGFETKIVDVSGTNTVNVQLAEGQVLDEVVVTALGIERSEKSLGYSVQQLGGEDITTTQSSNIVSNLAGNIAGVQVINAAGSSVGGSAKVRIRGVNGLTSGNPLFVVDGTPISNANFSTSSDGSDFGNLASDVNPDDVETLSVLKGPAATALYGNRAKDGVVLITLKKGKKSSNMGVTISSSLTADKVYILPEYQNEYAGGNKQSWDTQVDPVDGKEYNVLQYSVDESWGPKIDGTQYRPWWSWYPGDKDYGQTVALTAQPDNVRNFYETGITAQNSISVNGGGEKTNFRISYANFNQKGIIPNSKFVKNSIAVSGGYNLTDKLNISANVNLLSNAGRARPVLGYTSKSTSNQFNQWFQRQVDIDRLKDYYTDDGIQKSWNILNFANFTPKYWDNPYFIQYESYNTDTRSRYYGNVKATYDVTDDIKVTGVIHRDDYTQRIQDRNASNSLDLDYYSESARSGREDNYEFRVDYSKRFEDFTLDANFGGNKRVNNYRSNTASTAGGLSSPNLFTLEASVDRPNVTSYLSEKIVNSLYGAANFGYKDFLYIGATLRNDWSSALPKNDNSYFYPSVSGSLVFSELMNSSVLSYGKLRASWAQVGSDLAAYRINKTYSNGTPYGSVATFAEPNQIIDPNLKPALSTSYEVGFDLKFLNDRYGIDVTYYNQDSRDEILPIDITGVTGYTTALVNAGLFRSSGIEVALNATPIQTENFVWNIAANFAKNSSKVVELYEDLDNYRIAGFGSVNVNAKVGEQWGIMYGRGYTYDDNGNVVITESGNWVRDNNAQIGSLLPELTGGLRTGFQIGSFDVNAMLDFQIGGSFYSITKRFNGWTGLAAETVGLNDKGNPKRDPVDQGGGILVEGVLESGEPHSVYVDANTYYYNKAINLREPWVIDATYVKWRELSVGYTFPRSMFGGKFSKFRLATIVRNPLLVYSKVEGLDPTEVLTGSTSFAWYERGGLPGTRSLGLKLDIGF